MKILFYCVYIPSGLAALFVLIKTLSGSTKGPSSMSEQIVATLASLIVLGMSYWAFLLATKQQSPGIGIGVIALSWLIFIIMMLVTGLFNTKSWN